MEESNTPKLRFGEFEGVWRERSLGEFLIQDVRIIPKPKTPFLALGIRSHFKGVFQKPDFDPGKIAMTHLYQVKENDLIVNITFAWEGAVAIAKKEDEDGLVSHRFPTYVFDEEKVRHDYFQYVFPTNRWKYDLKNISPGGAGRNRVLKKSDFLKMKTFIPSLPEQQKIAEFLGSVDAWIENLKSQKASLEQYKKGVMQKIFRSSSPPARGGVPSPRGEGEGEQLRFRDENSKPFPEWEEKTLGEISSKSNTGLQVNALTDANGEYPVYGASGYLRSINFYQEKNPYIAIVKDGSGVGRVRFYSGKSSIIGTMNVIKSKKNILPYFLFLIMKNLRLQKYIIGGSIPHIYYKDYVKEKILLPSFPEQQKIADFLTSFDDAISAKSEAITHAEQWKKGLMQKMFV